MAKANRPTPFSTVVALEDRAAAIISSATNAGKTEQQALKALKAAGIDVRKLPSQFVSTKIEDGLKAAILAANALRTPRKKKPAQTVPAAGSDPA
jgi:hypothetical protein